jgi:hypothetical protein
VLTQFELSDLLPQQPDRLAASTAVDRDPDRLAGRLCHVSRFNFRGKYWIVGADAADPDVPAGHADCADLQDAVAAWPHQHSLTGLIVYTAFNVPFATFLMQSFFDGIPKDLEEAAMIDGATNSWPSARSSCR